MLRNEILLRSEWIRLKFIVVAQLSGGFLYHLLIQPPLEPSPVSKPEPEWYELLPL